MLPVIPLRELSVGRLVFSHANTKQFTNLKKFNVADPLSRISIAVRDSKVGSKGVASIVADQYVNIIDREAVPHALKRDGIVRESKSRENDSRLVPSRRKDELIPCYVMVFCLSAENCSN